MSRVLVADDDETVREATRLLLEDAGYAVAEAADGAAALGALRASAEPLVVLLDIAMPGVSGVAILAAAAAGEERLARHAYIAWTASPRRVPPELLAATGAPLLPKPFDIDDLLGEVAAAAARLGGAAGA